MFALCGLAAQYFPEAHSIGNMWRVGTDDGSWNTVLGKCSRLLVGLAKRR